MEELRFEIDDFAIHLGAFPFDAIIVTSYTIFVKLSANPYSFPPYIGCEIWNDDADFHSDINMFHGFIKRKKMPILSTLAMGYNPLTFSGIVFFG